MKIADSIIDLIGSTPLCNLHNYSKQMGLKTPIIAKLEMFNPLGSSKDRIAYAMLKDAAECGLINKDTVIIEPTSGNTGIGLAAVSAVMGYRTIIVMPSNMSAERILTIKALGASVELSDAKLGMKGAIELAKILKQNIGNAYMPMQFDNVSNKNCHKNITAMEVISQTDGKLDYFVAGIGSGGTVSGVGETLKERFPSIKIIAVEPLSSPLLTKGEAGAHKIQGIGANFVPSILNLEVIDEIIDVSNEDAYISTRLLASLEGLMCGISSGACLHAASVIAKKDPEARIMAFLPDSGMRYLTVENLF